MNVVWGKTIEVAERRVEWSGTVGETPRVGVGAGGIAVETSGLLWTIVGIGVFGLAIYGLVTAIRKAE